MIGPKIRWYIRLRWAYIVALAVPGLLGQYLHEGLSGTVQRGVVAAAMGLSLNGLLWLVAKKTKGSFNVLGVALVAIDILLATYIIYANGGIESRGVILYAIPIILASSLFGARGSYGAAFASFSLYDLLMVADFSGLVQVQSVWNPPLHNDGGYLLSTTMFYTAVLVTVGALANFVNKVLAHSQAAYKKQAESLDEAQWLARIGSWEWNIIRDEISWSDELYRIFGLEPQQTNMTYKSYLEHIHKDDRESAKSVIERALKDHKPFIFDHRVIHSDGTVRWIHSQGRVLVEGIKPFKMQGTAQDITEIKRTQLTLQDKTQQLDLAKQRADAIFASIGEGLIVVDEYGQISDINQSVSEILGYSKEELVGKWLPKAIVSKDDEGKDTPPTESPVSLALETGKPVSERINYVKKDGTSLPVQSTAAPFLIEGKPQGAVIVFRDITKEREIDQAKDEFISLVSHQLRTPLTSIRLFSEMLFEGQVGNLNVKQKDYVDKIQLSTVRMIKLVIDILNTSRIEMGRVKVEPQPLQLADLIQTELDELEPVVKEKKVKIEFAKPPKLLPPLPLDEVLMDQVIHNLLTNAVRYTPAGGKVTIGLDTNGKDYQVSVTDTGIGIPEDEQPKIFQRFFRAENAVRTEAEGTGLGLYLVKMILDIAGGKIWFESKQGKGTTFYVTIPSKGMKKRAGEKSLATSES